MNTSQERHESATSELGLGTSSYHNGTKGAQSFDDFLALIDSAITQGVSHIDTARTYLGGESERWVGKALHELNARKKVSIATKCHLQPSREESKRIVDLSFSQLDVDFIDIYYIHWPKEGISSYAMLETLFRYKEEGLIGEIGLCNYPVPLMEEFIDDFAITYYQFGYNLLWRIPEFEIIPFCRKQGIELITYSSLAQGLLTNKQFPPVLPKSDVRNNSALFAPQVYKNVLSTSNELKSLADSHGMSIQALAMHWLLSQEAVRTVLFTASSIMQLQENVAALSCTVDSQVIEEATNISSRLKAILPEASTLFS